MITCPAHRILTGRLKASLRGQNYSQLALPIAVVFAIIAWQNEILIEGILAITIGLMILAAIRR